MFHAWKSEHLMLSKTDTYQIIAKNSFQLENLLIISFGSQDIVDDNHIPAATTALWSEPDLEDLEALGAVNS